MNGAESLVRTLRGCGVEVCFTNPGTSEMHFVVALDRIPGMRCVLGLHSDGTRVEACSAQGDRRARHQQEAESVLAASIRASHWFGSSLRPRLPRATAVSSSTAPAGE